MKLNIVLAKKLRKEMTDAEKLLWYHLRRKQLGGFRFRRQQPIGHFIVDFVCLEMGVVIELDGGQHANQTAEDKIRDLWLKNEGYKVLRFWNNAVFKDKKVVLETILKACRSPSP